MDNLSPDNKQDILFTLSVKDGNRIGRRLRRGLGKIGGGGKNIGNSGLNQEPFDPNAYDGDGDGLIQDGSVWERPAILRAQSIPDISPTVGTDKPETLKEEIQKETRQEIQASRRAVGTDKRKKRSRALSSSTADSGNPEWRRTATPRELADAMVPLTLAETDELAERLNVPRENYASDENHQEALALHRGFVNKRRERSGTQIASLTIRYEATYGPGSFAKDLRDSGPVFHDNMQELFGSSNSYAEQLTGLFSPNDPEMLTQQMYLLGLKDDPNAPQFLRTAIEKMIETSQRGEPLTHGFFFARDPSGNSGDVKMVPISPMEFILARLLAEQIDPTTGRGNLGFATRGSSVDDPITPRRVDGADGYQLAGALLKDYFDFRTAAGARLGTTTPSALTHKQIDERIKLAMLGGTRSMLIGTIFPGAGKRNAYFDAYDMPAMSDDVRDFKMIRALLERTLTDNPEFLEAVRVFGMPVIYVPHKVYSFVEEHPLVTDRILFERPDQLTNAERGIRLQVGKHYADGWEKSLNNLQRGISPEYGGTNIVPTKPELGGLYSPAINEMVLSRVPLMAGVFAPSEAERGILKISNTESVANVIGESGVLVHEYGHFVDFILARTVYGAKYEQARREIIKALDMGMPREQLLQLLDLRLKKIRQEVMALAPSDHFLDVTNIQRALLNAYRDPGNQLPRVTGENRVTGPLLVNPSDLTDKQLIALENELMEQIREIHGDTLLQKRRKALRGRRNAQSVLDTAENIGADSVSSPEPYVVTPYGHVDTRERFAEIMASVLTRTGQKYPVLVNNAAVKLVARIFGMSVEPQDVTTQSRRKKLRTGRYSDETEDISDRILSAIKVVSPELKRTSDGHRPGLSSQTESRDLRFDADERSRTQSRSNIGLDTDERLYAFSDVPMIKDRGAFGSAPRTYRIGDHHFYDYDAPFSERGRRFNGAMSAQSFINRDRPHHGDMMRAISATQLGFFVDDMPTYPTTTAGQKRLLRALITGRIAKGTTPDERGMIERAMKDTVNLFQDIQTTKPTKRDIYRAINVDTDTFLESIVVGDKFPMPLTSFGDKAPNQQNGAILRIQSGAKARQVNLSDDVPNYITAGNFEVVGIERDNDYVVATLRHLETFDPRHSAMRPVDEKLNDPFHMRFMGSNQPRYNAEQVQRMTTDLERRRDRAKAIGLRSSTSADDELDKEIDKYVGADATDEGNETIIKLTGQKIKEFVSKSVSARLRNALQAVIDKHGTKTPWIDDAQALRDWRTIDHASAVRSADLLLDLMDQAIRNGDIYNRDGTRISEGELTRNIFTASVDKKLVGAIPPRPLNEDEIASFSVRNEAGSSPRLTSGQIRHFLNTGELTWGSVGVLPYYIKVPQILPENRDTAIGVDDDFAELEQVLELTSRALDATARAYMLDGSLDGTPFGGTDVWGGNSYLAGTVKVGDLDIDIKPEGMGVYTQFGQSEWGGMSLNVSASIEKRGGADEIRQVGRTLSSFDRKLYTTSSGKIVVEHSRFWIPNHHKELKSSGVGTLFNQHSALWWRQHDRVQVSLPSPVSDGVIVWPRLGYKMSIDTSQEVEEFSEIRSGLIGAVRNALKGEFNSVKISYEMDTSGRPNVLNPNEPTPPRKVETPVLEQDLDFGIDNASFRRRLVGWLALAEKQKRDGGSDTSIITLLANIIEPKSMSPLALKNWNQLFNKSRISQRGLVMDFDGNDGTETDRDWLPEFLIPDPAIVNTERSENIEERSRLLSEAYRSNGDKGIERDLFVGPGVEGTRLTKEQTGRINGALSGDSPLSNLREASGFNVPPLLFSRAELAERQKESGAPLYGIGRIDTINGSNQMQQFMFGTNDSSDIVRFTSEPFRYINQMYVDGLPNSDPATTKSGVIGYLAPWAQTVPRTTLRGILNSLIEDADDRHHLRNSGLIDAQKYVANRDFDGLMGELIDAHYLVREYDAGMLLERKKPLKQVPRFAVLGYGAVKYRILDAIQDLDNQHRMQNSEQSKYKDTRDALLSALFSNDPNREEIVATLLGYDAIRESNNITVLNNGAMSVMDEVISFAEAAKLNDFQQYRVVPQNMNAQLIFTVDWFDVPEDARLFMRDDAIVLPSNGVIPSDYIRSVRQDFNVDLSERRGGLASRSRRDKERDTFRYFDRAANPTVWTKIDDDEFKAKIESAKERFASLQAELEAWDEANLDLDRPDWYERDEIYEKISVLTDEVASLIKTSNGVIDGAIAHEAAIEALTAFLKERHGVDALQDIPDDILLRVATLLQSLLQERNDNPRLLSIDTARKRHGYLKRLLRDTDLGYELRKSGERFDDDYDIELEDVDADFDVQDKSESLLEHLFRGLFDERYDKWAEKQRYVPFGEGNPAFDAMRRLLPPQPVDASDVMGRRIQDLFEGITREQRREWHTASGQLLDDEYNWEYEEDIIDATPTGGSTRPSEIPAPTWRKVRAAMQRARATTFDGERQAAEEAALRLIGKHRPDLATREYVQGIRSSTSNVLPTSRMNFAPQTVRGGSPDLPAVPLDNQTLSIMANKLRELGHDITEADLLKNGRVGRVMRSLVIQGKSRQEPLTEFIRDAEDGNINVNLAQGLSPELIRDIVAVTVEQARKQGLGIVKIEGHSVKKILGPVDNEIADILGDELDISMLRAHGAPTYEILVDVAAYYYAERKRLDKMFGESEVRQIRSPDEVYADPYSKGAYDQSMNREPVKYPQDKLVYLDVRGNEIASFDNSNPELTRSILSNMNTAIIFKSPGELATVLTMREISQPQQTNDVIFGVMAEAVGFDYGKPGLTFLRNELETLKKLYSLYSFAPTPAGQHVRSLFENIITEKQIMIDLTDRMGKRYVHLLKGRGLSDSDIRDLLKSHRRSLGLDPDEPFQEGEPIANNSGSVLEVALSAFVRKSIGNPSTPYFTDGDLADVGLHEIGHFGLGQAFTRHGEFVANAWPFFVHGPAFWPVFARLQRAQSELFDQWTIKEHFGRVVTPEQRETMKSTFVDEKHIKDFSDFVDTMRHTGLTDDDRAKILQDVIESVRQRPDMSEREKQEVIDDINTRYEADQFFIPSVGRRARSNQSSTDWMVKAAESIGLPPELIDTTAGSVKMFTMFDPLIPMPSHMFGWQRASSPRPEGMKSSTSRKFTKVKGGRPKLPGRDISKSRTEQDFENDHPDAVKEAKKLRTQALKYFKSLSPREIDAVTEYIESSFAPNYFLRYGEVPPRGPGMPVLTENGLLERTEELTDILDNSPPLTQPIVLYRGLSDIAIEDYDHLLALGVGGEFSDEGIVSTSTSPSMAGNFMGRTEDSASIPMLEIIVPKGGQALSLISRKGNETDDPLLEEEYNPVIGELFGSPVVGSYEQEVLLPPKTKFKIIAIIPSKDVPQHDGAFSPNNTEIRPKIIVEVIPRQGLSSYTAPPSNIKFRTMTKPLIRKRVEERLKDVLALKQYKEMNPQREALKQKYIELYSQSVSNGKTEAEVARLRALMDEALSELTASDSELNKRINEEKLFNQSRDAMRILYDNSSERAQMALNRMIVSVLRDDSKLKQNRENNRNMIIEIASGGNMEKIARKYGVSVTTVYKYNKKHKEVTESREKETASQQFDSQIVSDFVADKIELDRLANMTYPEIAKKYNLTTTQVEYVLRKLRDVKRPERQFAKRNREILKLHLGGATDEELASKFKLYPSTIRLIIRKGPQ